MRFNQRSSARHPQGGRLQIGIGGRLPSEQVAGFKSESAADFKSEWVAGLRRNPQCSRRSDPAAWPVAGNPVAQSHLRLPGCGAQSSRRSCVRLRRLNARPAAVSSRQVGAAPLERGSPVSAVYEKTVDNIQSTNRTS